MVKKFTKYVLEKIEEKEDFGLKLKNMINDTLKTSDIKTLPDFISAYKTDSDKYQINGLINDSDIWDTYTTYKLEIDEILNKNDFYYKSPEELNVFSLYDYVIEGTKEAVKIKINNLNTDTFESF